MSRAYSFSESSCLSWRRESASIVPPCRTHASRPPRRLAPAVQPLKALPREFNIENSAARKLDVEGRRPLPAAPRSLPLRDALARFGDNFDRREVRGGRIYPGLYEIQQLAP